MKKGKSKVTLTYKYNGRKYKTSAVYAVKDPDVFNCIKVNGKKINLKLEITPITTSQTTKITSSDKKVATVTKTGTVKAKKRGTATITVKSGKVKKKLTIKITK